MVIGHQQEFKLLERFVRENWGIPINLAKLSLVRKFNLNPVRFNKIVGLLQADSSVCVVNGRLYPPERVTNSKLCTKCGKAGYGYYTVPFKSGGIWYNRDLFEHYEKGKRTFCYIRGSCHRIDVEAEKAKGDLRHWTDTNTHTNAYKEQDDLPNVMEEEKDTISSEYKTPKPRDSSKMGVEQPQEGGMEHTASVQRNNKRITGEVRSNVSGSEGLRKGSSDQPVKETINPRLAELIREARTKELKGPLAERMKIEEEELKAGRGNVAVVEETE